jgi:hypothetical protein
MTSRQDNQLRSEALRFALRLPVEDLGSVGCRFVRIVVDPAVGEEVCLAFLDTPADAPRYNDVHPLGLTANTGLVRTPHGMIGAIVWQIGANSPVECFVEQFLNFGSLGTLRLLKEAAAQTHLKFIVLDNRTSDVTALADYENGFTLDALVQAMEEHAAEAAAATFDEAVQYAKLNADLIGKIRSQL